MSVPLRECNFDCALTGMVHGNGVWSSFTSKANVLLQSCEEEEVTFVGVREVLSCCVVHSQPYLFLCIMSQHRLAETKEGRMVGVLFATLS